LTWAKQDWLTRMPPAELDAMADRLTHLLATDHDMSALDRANCQQLLDLVVEEKLARRVTHA
jgi:hypothetical protein